MLVALNFSTQNYTLDLSEVGAQGEVLVCTEMDRAGNEQLATLHLRPNEGLVIRVRG
jgi:hypothetical protein